MSFILDALRKAERERSLGRAPALRLAADTAPRRAWRLPALLLTLLLAANAALLLWGLQPTAVDPGPTPPAARDDRGTMPEVPNAAPVPAAATTTTMMTTTGDGHDTAAPAAPPRPAIGGAPDVAPDGLSLDIHVYSERPARRFVVINGRRYQQGDRLVEGPLLRRIDPDGVWLDHRGRQWSLTVAR